jgi:hypothetical protein
MPALAETRPTTLSQSGIANLRSCARRYYNAQILRLERREVSESQRDGKGLHRALEAAAGRHLPEEQRQAAFQQVGIDLDAGRLRPLNAARIRAMIGGYFRQWGKLQTWAREYPLSGPIPGISELTFVGKVDRIIQTPGGFAILDYKTVERLSPTYLESLQRMLQGPLYAHYLEQEQGMEVTEVIYDLIVRPPSGMAPRNDKFYSDSAVPGSRQLKSGKNSGKWLLERKETMDEFEGRLHALYRDKPEEMILRPLVCITRENRAEALHELTLAAREVLWRLDTGNWGENRRECEGAFYPCPYRQLCYSRYNPVVVENEYTSRGEALDSEGIVE